MIGSHLENNRHFEKKQVANGFFQTSILRVVPMPTFMLVPQTERFFLNIDLICRAILYKPKDEIEQMYDYFQLQWFLNTKWKLVIAAIRILVYCHMIMLKPVKQHYSDGIALWTVNIWKTWKVNRSVKCVIWPCSFTVASVNRSLPFLRF